MKRIISLILILTMALVLISCTNGGNNGKTYTGIIYDDEETKLIINGNKATLSGEFTQEIPIEGGKKVQVTQKCRITGIITSNKNGVIAISFGTKGATATLQMKLSGDGAEAYKEMALVQIEQLEDGPVKNAQLSLINGKQINMAYGDDLWETMGPENDYVLELALDEEKGTFTEVEDTDNKQPVKAE